MLISGVFYKVVNKGFKKSFFKSCVELQEKYLADKGSDLGFFLKRVQKRLIIILIITYIGLIEGYYVIITLSLMK